METFAESRDNNLFLIIKAADIIYFTVLFICYSIRLFYWLIDTKTYKNGLHVSIPFITTREDNETCARTTNKLTTNDRCNMFCFLGVLIELIRVIDLNAWGDIIPFKGTSND